MAMIIFLYYLYIYIYIFFSPFIYFFHFRSQSDKIISRISIFDIYIFLFKYIYIFSSFLLFLDFERAEFPLYLGERFPFCLDQKEDHENHAQRADQREEEENRCDPDGIDHARERHRHDKRQYPVEQCRGRGSGPL